jgi:hypothetical protein
MPQESEGGTSAPRHAFAMSDDQVGSDVTLQNLQTAKNEDPAFAMSDDRLQRIREDARMLDQRLQQQQVLHYHLSTTRQSSLALNICTCAHTYM